MENETTWNQGRGRLEYIVDCFNGHYILYAAEQELVCIRIWGDLPNRSNFAILKIGIRYLAQICSRVKEKKKKVEMTLFALVTAAILDF